MIRTAVSLQGNRQNEVKRVTTAYEPQNHRGILRLQRMKKENNLTIGPNSINEAVNQALPAYILKTEKAQRAELRERERGA